MTVHTPPTHPIMQRPYPWEKSYPPGAKWDMPIRRGTVNDIWATAVAAYPTRDFMIYGGKSWSYEAFDALVARCAAGLLALGLKAGQPLALFLPNTPWHPLMFFAGLRIGARIAHISPLDAERDIVHKVRDTGARILVTTDVGAMAGAGQKLAAGLGAAGLIDKVIIGEDLFWRQGEDCARTPTGDPLLSGAALLDAKPLTAGETPSVQPGDVALMQYTGGTTGLPKAALLSHDNLFTTKEIFNTWGDALGHFQTENAKCLLVLPLFHIYALSAVLLAMIPRGYGFVLHPRFDAEAAINDIEKYKIDVFPGVPTMWIAIANFPGIEKRDLSSLRRIASGGAPCPVEIEQKIKAMTKLPLGGGWGMTETAPAGTNIPTHGVIRFGTIGVPLPGILMDIVALDDPTKILPIGEIGEIRIKGPNVIAGYHNRPEENAKAFVDGYLLTGDMGRMDADGYFEIVDRKKDMIISGGFNVYPRHIEEAMYEHPSVAEVIVIGVQDAYRGEAAKAFVKLKPGAPEFSLDELKAFLADKIARYEVPAHLEFRKELPRTPVGKLSKKELVAEERAKAAKG